MAEDEIGYYWYEGCPLEDKIAWMREGEGSPALFEAQAALAQLGFDLVESERSLRDQVRLLGSSWEGTAGTAAGEAMMVAARWSADSAPAADQAWSQVGLQSESVDRTKNGMPGTAPAPEYGFGDAFGDAVNMQTGNLFDVQTNFDDQVARRRAADELANRLLYEHEAASRANLAAMPALGEVPTITVRTEEQSQNPHLLEQEQVTENIQPPRVGDEKTDRPTERSTDKPENRVDGEPPKDRAPEDTGPQTQERQDQEPQDQDLRDQQSQDPRNTVPQQDQGRQSLRPNDSVSAAGYVPELDRPHQPAYRGSLTPGAGTGSLGGGFTGGFGGGFGGGDTVRGVTRGPGPQSGAAPGRGPAGAAAARGVGPAGGGRGGSGMFGQPPAGRGGDEEDGEHSDKYFRGTDELFRTDDIPALGQSVIGADDGSRP